jgi:serine/threonine protein kinase/tetratricopeptide (TPR) repeat protein
MLPLAEPLSMSEAARPPAPVRLGPFELQHLVGRGGMAEVWRGVHVAQQIPVAIKVITGAYARQPAFVSAFATEVQAVARLTHPGIVMVLDLGEVSPDAERASKGRLLSGSPYLAMEYASRGTLEQVAMPLPFLDLLPVLYALLDALAHAHARGIIHRDIKPGNVLLSADDDARPGLKLTDFGIAHPLESEVQAPGGLEQSVGTPHFMSPEQIEGEWRDYGPWTDLYALGCLAFMLATGKVPFPGTLPQVVRAHLFEAPPRLASNDTIPAGFEDWLRKLLEKEPRRRFLRAADAAWALATIDVANQRELRLHPPARNASVQAALDASQDGRPITLPKRASASPRAPSGQANAPTLHTVLELPTVSADGDLTLNEGTLPWGTIARRLKDAAASSSSSRDGDGDGDADADATPPTAKTLHTDDLKPADDLRPSPWTRLGPPPLPSTWRRAARPAPPMRLVGAGLALYGLRTIPLVDRDDLRDAVWTALEATRAGKSARLLYLHGAAGNGKSRLIEWMTQRADEVGGATVLKAVHSPIASPNDGLPRMIARHLRLVGLERGLVLARLERVLRSMGVTDPYEWMALTELVSPSTGPAPAESSVSFRTASERYALVRRLIERLAHERPVIVRLEDVQWGAEAMAFARHLLEAQERSPSPVLLLLSGRDEAFADRPAEAELLRALLSPPEATARPSQRPSAAPAEPILAPGPGRAESAARALLVPTLSAEDHRVLVQELLHLEGDLATQVAARTGGNPLFAVQLVGDWVSRGVLEVSDRGFVLQNGEAAVLPDDIHQVWTQRLSRALVGLPQTAQAAIETAAVLGNEIDLEEWQAMLEDTKPVEPGLLGQVFDALIKNRLAIRVPGGFAFAHGMLRESLERSAREEGRHQTLHRMAASMLRRRYGMRRHGLPERLARHYLAAGALELALAPLLAAARERYESSEYPAARALIAQRADALQRLGTSADDQRWADGWVLEAHLEVLTGRLAEALVLTRRAEEQARRHGFGLLLAETLWLEANIAYRHGDAPAAIPLYRSARNAYEGGGDVLGSARSVLGIGDAEYRLGNLRSAEQLYDEALALFERKHDPFGIADCLWGLGYVAMWRGDLARAEALFQRQLAALESSGNRFSLAGCLNSLAEVKRLSGESAAAEAGYRRAIAMAEAIGSIESVAHRSNLGLVLIARGQLAAAAAEVRPLREGLIGKRELGQLATVDAIVLPGTIEEGDLEGWDMLLEEIVTLLGETGLVDGDLASSMQVAGDRAAAAGHASRARLAYGVSRDQWRSLKRADKQAEVEAKLRALGAA